MAPPRLLLRSAILEGESLKGYLMRLALLNGYRHLGWLLRAANVHPSALDRGTASLEGLAAMTGCAVPELEAIYWPASVVHRHRPSQHRLADATIPAWLLNVRHPRVCPPCIREGRPIQRAWEIAWTSCCPRHGNCLISRCSQCDKPLSWDRPWLHRCACGFRLPTLPVREAPPAEIALSALLGNRFVSGPITDTCQALPPWLLALPSTELPSLLLKLSTLEIDAKAPQQLSSMRRNVDTAKSVTTWLADLLSKWPGSITSHLDRAMAQPSTPESLRGQAIRVRETVRELLANDAPAEIRKTLQTWIAASREQPWLQPGGTLSELTSRANPNAKRTESLRTSLGLGKQAFSYALSMIEASVVQPGRSTSHAQESEESAELEQLVARWRASLSELEVVDTLGLPRRDIGSLVRAGLLTPESIPWDGYKFSKRFDRRQLDQLVSRIFAMTTPATEPASPDLDDLMAIRTQFGRHAFVGHLVTGILSGRLKCYWLEHGGPAKLSQIRLNIHEVKAHLYPSLPDRAAIKPFA